MAYNLEVRVTWDPAKDHSNREKHGVSFDEARALFEGAENYLVLFDVEHSDDEDRFLAIGPIRSGVIVVAYTEEEDDLVRIISARKATMRERTLFYDRIGGKR
ncbi:MAG: BrnT family toxin [Deltaproteobacteria bacterium]|nr:BrnT family toxin [Deltaproteobacteria bacterium]